MSKGGAKRAEKKREVMALVNEAAEKKLLGDTLAEQQAEMARQQRAHNVWWQCRFTILNKAGGLYSLPGEVIGAEIAESMMRAAYERMLRVAVESRARQEGEDPVKPGDIRLASPLIVPG